MAWLDRGDFCGRMGRSELLLRGGRDLIMPFADDGGEIDFDISLPSIIVSATMAGPLPEPGQIHVYKACGKSISATLASI
mmetsp:Transcript_289/g.586  ORF Transcript_289/g.586 Transcript_289/m.586 type:complete len:80 (+) Transcript_289:52-291(+)